MPVATTPAAALPPSVLSRLVENGRTRAMRAVDWIGSGPYWQAKAVGGAVLLAYLMSFPSVDVIMSAEFDQHWSAIVRQFEAPFVPRQYDAHSHESKMAFRLTVPVLANVVGFGHRGALVLQVISGIAVLWLGLLLALRATGDRALAIICTLGLATTFPGIAAFCDDYRGHFDGVAFALVLASMAARQGWLVFAFTFLAAYTDERALLASTLVLAWWWLQERGRGFAIAAVLLAWVTYGATRLWLTYSVGLSTPLTDDGLVGISVMLRQIDGLPFSIWTALESLWAAVIAALAVLVASRRWALAAWLAGCTGAMLLASNAVTDATRSAAYVLPVLFIALKVLDRYESRERLRALMLACSLLAILIPTYYTGLNEIRWYFPAPLQLFRMAFYSGAAA